MVREVWAKVLGLAEASFADTDRFAGLGGGSLKAMEALAALEQALDITLGPAVMRNDTVAALTDQLLDVLSDRNSDRQAPHRPAAHGERERPATDGGQERPAADGGQERPAVDGGRERPAADGGQERDAVTAVVGLACRFPGAGSPEEFWELLMAGRDAVTAVPAGRWDSGGRSRADERERWGAFLDDPAAFDADHFGIGAEEARALDPQARIFLELAHEALERAGYAGPRRRGLRIGVFAAVGDSGYRQVLADAAPDGAPAAAAALTGNLPNLVAARVAHCLDLDGPALAVDTACSSGLVALHLARRSLADGECDLAVVGGVNLHLTPAAHQALEAAQALS
ncbi:beta-ketoacyl synthase N-terminal-like domain-containing protein, partial [Streptomyces sp. SID7804]|uniref:beta-ketoacyl synthase N-terminal-like domain-containing protein n=1 Tax=Streptomyces sp. SID7804 TaxID=2690327 RepID=UPI0031F67268